jgi:molybdopterin-guanine dinucleotide biosynthesis protein A
MSLILCVLAGGRSSRFGSSKLLIHIDGQPLLSWLAQRLRPVVQAAPSLGHAPRSQLWLSLAPLQSTPPGANAYDRFIVDAAAGQGPLSGVLACLSAARPDDVVVFVTADAPAIEAQRVSSLVRALASQSHAIAMMGRWTAGPRCGRVEPFPCVFRAGLGLTLVRRAMLAGVTGPVRLSRWSGVATVPQGQADAHSTVNINHRADLASAAAALGRAVTVV